MRGVEDGNRQVILQTHNSLRSILASGQETRGQPGPQPQASNMQILVGGHFSCQMILLHLFEVEHAHFVRRF